MSLSPAFSFRLNFSLPKPNNKSPMAKTLGSNCPPPPLTVPSIISKWRPSAAKSSQFPNLSPHRPYHFNPNPSIQLQRPLKFQAAALSSSSSVAEHEKNNEGPMGIDTLRQFIDLNLGKWNGSFYVSWFRFVPLTSLVFI